MTDNVYFDESSLSRRQLLNFLTGGVVAVTLSSALYPAIEFITPPEENVGENGSILAKDILGKLIPAAQIQAESPGTRALVAGFMGEPTYLTVIAENEIDPIGIVDNCTHLGCTFPWNSIEGQFQCPCHGSRFAEDGSVIRGPANRALKLVRISIVDNFIQISPWTETDPRTGQKPWWV